MGNHQFSLFKNLNFAHNSILSRDSRDQEAITRVEEQLNRTPLMDSSSGSQDKKSKDNDRREAKGSPCSCFALFCFTFVHCLF